MRGHSPHLWVDNNIGRGLAARDGVYRERSYRRDSVGDRNWIVVRLLQAACPSSTITLRQPVLSGRWARTHKQ